VIDGLLYLIKKIVSNGKLINTKNKVIALLLSVVD